MIRFQKELELPISREELWNWHVRNGAFQRLSPPWQKLSLERFDGVVEDGLGIIALSVGPVKLRWHARHLDVDPPRQFVDFQEKGPFKYWKHTHSMIDRASNTSTLRDAVDFELPLPFISEAFGKNLALKQIDNLFSYRHRIMERDLAIHSRAEKKNLNVLISGASGLLGTQLTAFLESGGHEVYRLVRRSSEGAKEIVWSPSKGELDLPPDLAFDAVVHLSGANVGKIPWSKKYKEVILDSRTDTTELLVSKLMQHPNPPSVFISAAGIGYYGDQGEREVEISDPVGNGFLAEVCEAWEASSLALEHSGIRRVVLRLGPVVTSAGGMLQKLILPAKLGLGATIGKGKEWMSWVALDDVLYSIFHIIQNDSLNGAVNLCSPQPVRMLALTDTLSSVLSRPRFLRMPAGLVKKIGGEAVEAMILTSTKAKPKKLEASGFTFSYPDIREAISHTLGKA